MRRSRLRLPLARRRDASRAGAPPVAGLAALLPADRAELARDDAFLDRLRACVHPDLYAAQLTDQLASDAGTLDVDSALRHFVAHGAREGKRTCALFNPGWYLAVLQERGLEMPEGVPPFFHWLTVGWQEQIVPTPLFDEEFYRASHPGLAQRWLFPHYLTRGCYRTQWRPSPFGQHHPGGDDPTAADRQRPLLLREMLHRASEHDLTQSSWLEQGCLAAMEVRRTLESPTMREMVAKAGAIDPLVTDAARRPRPVSCPPHRHPRLYLAEQARSVQRELGGSSVETVVLVRDRGQDSAEGLAQRLARAFDAGARGRSLVVIADVASADTREHRFGESVRVLDLGARAEGMDPDKATALVLDLVRGLEARRIVTVGSSRGWDLITAYGRQLSTEAELGAVVLGSPAGGALVAPEVVRDCLAVLDWVLLDDAVRADLVQRYLLPEVSQRRLVPLSVLAGDRSEGAAAEREQQLVERLAQVPRRRT